MFNLKPFPLIFVKEMQILSSCFCILVGIYNQSDKHIQHNYIANKKEKLEVYGPPYIVMLLWLTINSNSIPSAHKKRQPCFSC